MQYLLDIPYGFSYSVICSEFRFQLSKFKAIYGSSVARIGHSTISFWKFFKLDNWITKTFYQKWELFGKERNQFSNQGIINFHIEPYVNTQNKKHWSPYQFAFISFSLKWFSSNKRLPINTIKWHKWSVNDDKFVDG